MELASNYANIQPLTPRELEVIEGGAYITWPQILIGLGIAFITNIPDALKGAVDGWNAYHP